MLYEYLKKGTSNRQIESVVDELKEEDGWQSWSIIHFYGFDKFSKKKYPYITKKNIKERLSELSDTDLEELHLHDNDSQEAKHLNIVMNKNDGKDIFRYIKTRQGQHKLRRLLLQNYKSQCALCKISHPALLITSHIKPWSNSSDIEREERIDPCNAILLCKLHDALFDNGYISLDDDYQVLFSSKFDFKGQGILRNLTFRKPIKNLPSRTFLEYHRIHYGYDQKK